MQVPEHKQKERLLCFHTVIVKPSHSGDGVILLISDVAHLSATFISDMRGEFELYLFFLKLKNIFTLSLTGFGKSQIYSLVRS